MTQTGSSLATLGAETWGERFGRARARKGVKLRQAAEMVSEVIPTSYGTLVRLEQMAEPPPDRKRRVIAYVALLAYGFDPLSFDLTEEDGPKWLTPQALKKLTQVWNATTSPRIDDTESAEHPAEAA